MTLKIKTTKNRPKYKYLFENSKSLHEACVEDMENSAIILNHLINSMNGVELPNHFYNICTISCHRNSLLCSRIYRITLFINKKFDKLNEIDRLVS